eukprot:TRINITY_DN7608_c1_g1_i1.p1 TRINITY_DN7608_c1_g1~~TRINITY_DN7608_c1_g1_i1.p1  ORF type:complete len:345 (+),score=53.91 TRINITY_DN7608_c1_g1_i1:127-1035(+)
MAEGLEETLVDVDVSGSVGRMMMAIYDALRLDSTDFGIENYQFVFGGVVYTTESDAVKCVLHEVGIYGEGEAVDVRLSQQCIALVQLRTQGVDVSRPQDAWLAAVAAHNEGLVELLLRAAVVTQPLVANAYAKAAASDDVQAVTFLAEHVGGADVRDNDTDRTPLHIAARLGCSAVITALLGAGADPDTANSLGCTPLHLAARKGHVAAAAALLAGGAAPSERDKCDRTPLHQAARDGHWEIVQFLVRAGADTEAQNEFRMPLPQLRCPMRRLILAQVTSPQVTRLCIKRARKDMRKWCASC